MLRRCFLENMVFQNHFIFFSPSHTGQVRIIRKVLFYQGFLTEELNVSFDYITLTSIIVCLQTEHLQSITVFEGVKQSYNIFCPGRPSASIVALDSDSLHEMGHMGNGQKENHETEPTHMSLGKVFN